MAEIAPLKPLRYDLSRLPRGLASVIAPPYDVISPAERAELAARDPHNIVRLILPESAGGRNDEANEANEANETKYANAAALLERWRAEGVLVRDDEPAFYRYDQTFAPPGSGGAARLTRRGFLALVRLVPFSERVVLPHERTLSGPKEDRLKLFRATRTNLSPGFMLYRDPRGELDAPLGSAEPLAEYDTPDGVHHALARVRAPGAIRAIVAGIARSSLLIADGHHRYETALRYADEVSSAVAGSSGPSASARGEHRFFMTFLVNGDDPHLVVFPTHRHVHSLASFSFDRLVEGVRTLFDVKPLPDGAAAADVVEATRRAGERAASMAAAARDGRVVLLTLRPDADLAGHPTLGLRSAPLRRTDVTLLHAGILEHVLGITPAAQAAKTNLGYPQDAGAALAELRGGRGDALFIMNATPVSQVREVAESGEVMPQKSTYFYPKVPTGLAVHTLDPARWVVVP
ncbi:MAG: DUF1015 domain-containing protein [Myxococcales bacterium]|nr:DUF1015 domain-containing protein [Myxococcales bacterium]